MYQQIFYLLGYVLFCAGTLLGIPHGLSKRKGNPVNTERWRVAHLSTCLGGISIIGITIALETLVQDDAVYTLSLFTLAAYCFFAACTLSGWLEVSWDGDRTLVRVKSIYWMQIVASGLSLLAIFVSAATFFLRTWGHGLGFLL
jgi:hypothetical protein